MVQLDVAPTREVLAREIVDFVFQKCLGRKPEEREYAFQTSFLLDNRMSVGTFFEAIRTTDEGRRFEMFGPGAKDEKRFVVDGCDLLIPGDSELALHLSGPNGYEWWALPLFLDACRPGATVADIGANWGIYSIPAARRVGPDGHVFAFEPNTKNAKILFRNAMMNGLENIHFMTTAVSEQFGLAALPVEIAQNSGTVITHPSITVQEALSWEPVSAIPLDAMRGQLGRVELMKMDIEGGEFRACKGAYAIISEDRPTVFLEFTPILLRSISWVEPAALLELFLDLGYTIDILHQARPAEKAVGSREDIISRVCSVCDDVLTHVDLRLTPGT
jgi:FkbM family methyltransferase